MKRLRFLCTGSCMSAQRRAGSSNTVVLLLSFLPTLSFFSFLSTSSASLLPLFSLLSTHRIHDSMALTPGMKLGRESLVDIALRDASLDEEYVPTVSVQTNYVTLHVVGMCV